MNILIKHGRVIDPANKIDRVMDVLVEGSKIKRVAPSIKKTKKTRVMDARKKWVIPGMVDLHVHLREPGREDKEDIESGTRAAAASGITSLACMANTCPPIDNVSAVRFVLARARDYGYVNVYPVGAVTKNLAGEELAAIGSMALAGAKAISDDGCGVMNSRLYKQAMEYAKHFDLLVIDHSEDTELSKDGQANNGFMAAKMGLRGIPREAEYTMVARNIGLAQLTGARLHIAHVSTKESVDIIRKAKKKNPLISAETCPHYFTLTEDELANYNTYAKVKPPLRTQEDINAVIKGLQDGSIDSIASDHAPHTLAEKEQEFDKAPFGMIGMETQLPLIITELVDKKRLKAKDAIAKVTVHPARIYKINAGTLSPGAEADIAVIDPEMKKTVNSFYSKSSNSPFTHRELKGWAVATIVSGKIIMDRGEIVSG